MPLHMLTWLHGVADGLRVRTSMCTQVKDVANTTVLHWAGKILAMNEVRVCVCVCVCALGSDAGGGSVITALFPCQCVCVCVCV